MGIVRLQQRVDLKMLPSPSTENKSLAITARKLDEIPNAQQAPEVDEAKGVQSTGKRPLGTDTTDKVPPTKRRK